MVVAVAMAAATAMDAGMVPSSPPSSLPSSPEKDEEGAAGPLDGMSLKALLAHAEGCGVEAERLEAADGKAEVIGLIIEAQTAEAEPAAEANSDGEAEAEDSGIERHPDGGLHLSDFPPVSSLVSPETPAGDDACVVGSLRSHSFRLDHRLSDETKQLTGQENAQPGDDALVQKLRGQPVKRMKPEEKKWLYEQKRAHMRVKEEAEAKRKEKEADRQLLHQHQLSRMMSKRWGTNTRVKRREHEREAREAQQATLAQTVAHQWQRFQLQHAENLYWTYLQAPPNAVQMQQAAAQTDGGAGDHGDHVEGDFGGRLPHIPRAEELHTMDTTKLRASLGVEETVVDGRTKTRLRKQASSSGAAMPTMPPI